MSCETRDSSCVFAERRQYSASPGRAVMKMPWYAASGLLLVPPVLLAAGANKTKKDVSGKTALKRAKTAEMKRILR